MIKMGREEVGDKEEVLAFSFSELKFSVYISG